MQPIQFHREQSSVELEQPSGVSKNYSSERILSGTCSTVLFRPASVLLNAKSLVQTAKINSTQISSYISADEGSRQKESLWISNVVVAMFANIVLWMVVWCFDRFIQWQWITLKMPSCSSHLSCQLHQSESESYSTSFSDVILRLGLQSSRDQWNHW